MIRFGKSKTLMPYALLNSIAWLLQCGFWLVIFFIIFLITYLGAADMHQFRYMGF
jgi:hypothetical protein